ncbi:MAG: insulinase family protein, partial [Proteobacteria bacterium]|nr:insulinase family protein [Pseudomonadota bacterium]
GDPEKIPGLTFEAFREFHHRHYHPSNARMYFYGDDDPQERLRYLDACLSQFSAQPPDSSIALQPRLAEPRRCVHAYPAGKAEGPGGGKAMATVNWLLTPVVDVQTTLTLSMLAFTLLGMSASPLRKALLDSGLGDGLAGIGLEAELAQLYFSTGLKGVAPERLEEVEPFIVSALERIAREGIDPLTVEAAINTMEFSLRENNTGRFPLGLALMLRCLTVWLYGGDPFEALAFEAPLARLKERIATEPGLFSQLIRQHFLENTHRSTVLLTPDEQLAELHEAAEKQVLQQAKAALSQAEVQAVADNARELKRLQQTPDPPEALALIPRLGLADLERTNMLIPCENVAGRAGAAILYHDLFTSGILYLDIGLNLHLLPQQYLPYAGLVCRLLLETGTEREDFVSLSQRIGRSTGGLRCSIFTSSVVEASAGAAWLIMRGKAMASGIPELMAICGDILNSARVDDPVRFKQILLEERAAQEQHLVPSGHQLVSSRLQARFSEADWADEQMNGITYLQFLRQLEKRIQTDWESVAADVRAVRELLAQRSALVINVTADAGLWRSAQAAFARAAAATPGRRGAGGAAACQLCRLGRQSLQPWLSLPRFGACDSTSFAHVLSLGARARAGRRLRGSLQFRPPVGRFCLCFLP